LLGVTLLVNVGMLAFFKYANFCLSSAAELMAYLGWAVAVPQLTIVLPPGISFYIFIALSYTIDVYRRRAAPARSFLDFALLVAFFPHLIAGPILRADRFLPQCERLQRPALRHLGWGLTLIVVGYFEKAVVADGLLAPLVEKVYDARVQALSFSSAWCATLAFAGQIFCDFAGYSSCAIGAAMCLGFELPDNFRFPYAARGFSDFWRRWHISLSSWLRDYLYIPLGGNRQGPVRTSVNLLATMLLGGLWHGAAWTFVIWGGLHGLLLILERQLMTSRIGRLRVWETPLGNLALTLSTFVAVCITWVFFRADSLHEAQQILSAMLNLDGHASEVLVLGKIEMTMALAAVGSILLIHWLLRNTTLEAVASCTPAWVHALIIAMMIVAIVMTTGEDRAFIYFRF
jgi:D-alanyl-lipoteichoic acid acyltransferase DltB (MBOAT superfamily)